MWKERFGTMRRDPKTGSVTVIFVDGYADGFTFCYYKLGRKWHAIVRDYGLSIATANTRKDVVAAAHRSVDKLIEYDRINGESMRNLFISKAREAATI